MADPRPYEVYAIKYGDHQRNASENFLGGDPHNAPMPIDYFTWVIKGPDRIWAVDTGFSPESGRGRGRNFIRCPSEGLRALDIEAEKIDDVIITHMHYDHAGNRHLFGRARFHVQDKELFYTTGRCMCHATLARLRRRGRRADGAPRLRPARRLPRGRRGARWVVLASDASHFYANMEQSRPFPTVYNVADMLEGHKRAYALAESPRHVIPGHDPLVLKSYPAPHRDLQGIVARLDVEPRAE